MTEFISVLAPRMQDYIRYMQASDHWNESSYELNLKLFDRYCHKNHPCAEELTQEMVNGWCRQRAHEENNSCRSRTHVVVSFIKFLRARDLTEVEGPELPRIEKRTYIPHAFTQGELKNFFDECDSIPLRGTSKEVLRRKLAVPVFFRLLYSSGIRTTEARLLQKADVDLEQGILDIRYSKGRNQHYIVLHDSMLKLMRDYDGSISKVCPERTYFFPSKNDSHYTRGWVTANFRLLWDKVNTSHATAYELRHHYAVLNINRWVDTGFDFDDKLLYLSKSMGHTTIESTKYYYSIVPGLSQILISQTEEGFNWIVPEVPDNEEIY